MKGFLIEVPPDRGEQSSSLIFLYVPDANNFLLSAEPVSVGKRLKVESSECDSSGALVATARSHGFVKEVDVPFNLIFQGLMLQKLENDSRENVTRFGSYCIELRYSFTLGMLKLDVGGTDLHSFLDFGRKVFQKTVVTTLDPNFETRAREFFEQLDQVSVAH